MFGVGKSQPMKTIRRQDDGATEKMSPFQRINTEFGTLKSTPSVMVSSSDKQDNMNPIGASPSPEPSSSKITTRGCRNFTPRIHCTPHYSKFDKFIEGLDAACDALPTPLIGSANVPSSAYRATTTECSSITHDRHPTPQPPPPHHYYHRRKPHQEDRPLLPTGVVKEVKFADQVTEIGASDEQPEPMFSDRSVPEVREAAREMTNGVARVSRALRFDYRKKRSDFVKAATVLQSTYRGYKVRRGQPLKYLLVISSLKERLEELRQQFDAWKIAAWFPTDLIERATMTESVMDLLLQLDSLQGVPVVVREFRKNVARDVIKFQEEVDGFLCSNSKHGVLFDLSRPEGKAALGGSNLKPSKGIRIFLVQEPSNLNKNLRESNRKTCTEAHNNGSWREDVEGDGPMTSVSVTSEFGTDYQSESPEEGSYSAANSHGCSGQNFVLWSPTEAKFDKVLVEERSNESVTELKKCVASTGNADVHMPTERKKKLLGVRFGNLKFGNRCFGKERPSTVDACPHASPLETGPCNSSQVESSMKHGHPPPDVLSMDFTGISRELDDSKCIVSINKQKSLDPLPKDFRIISNVHENAVEDRDRHPQTGAESDYLPREKWEAKVPPDLHCENLMEMDKASTAMPNSLEPQDEDLRNLADALTRKDPYNDYFRDNQRKLHCFPSRCEFPSAKNVTECVSEHKSRKANTTALVVEPPSDKDEDVKIPADGVTGRNLYDNCFTAYNHTTLNALTSRVGYVSAKDIREGTTEPLLASDENGDERKHPVTTSQLECAYKGIQEHTDSSPRVSERIGISQDNLVLKERDSCKEDVCTKEAEQLPEHGIPGREPIEVGLSTLLKNSENAPMPISSTTRLNDNMRQQIDGEPESKYELCGFDDLETISSCSNCAAYPPECMGEPWDFESCISEQMPHQPVSLKGLVGELDEVFNERKGEDASRFEAGYWKDDVWSDYATTELQPFHVARNFDREVGVEREDDSFKSFRTFASDKVKCFPETAKKSLAQTKLASLQDPDIKKSQYAESKPLNDVACSSQPLGEEGVASSSNVASVSHQGENNSLLSKLVEDNKKLKELLKEVVKWNTVQANAMITLNERLELVESKK